MEFDGNKFALHIQLADTRLADEFFELRRESVTVGFGAEISEKYLRFLHTSKVYLLTK